MPSPDSLENPPVSGLVAGKYELVRMIGRGGMGSVWEGRHNSLATRVAIKFIDSEYADSGEARARFDNEARAAASLQSKHAIQIFDHGVTTDGKPYIVMELLLGEPLDKRIDRLGRITLGETARILQQVCRALQKAHDAGIIHRDLKPENIFLVADEDEEIAKVLDFGIAKIRPTPGQQGVSSSTKTGAVMGTPYYMSPEQARGLRSVDHRTDLWSLGVIAFKCVAGVLPFEGESVGDLLVKICTSPVPTPSLTVPDLPPSFDAWFFRALEREPVRRFSSAQELSEALAFACGVSLRRGAGGPSSLPGPLTQDAPIMHAAPPAVASVSGAAATLPFSTPGGPAMTASPFVSSPVAAKSSRGVLFASIAAAIVGVAVGSLVIVRFAGTKPTPTETTSPANANALQGRPDATSVRAQPGSGLDPLAPIDSTTAPTTPSVTHPGAVGLSTPAIKPPASAAASAKPPASAPTTTLAATTATATTTTAQPPPPPPPPRPKPTIDPGY